MSRWGPIKANLALLAFAVVAASLAFVSPVEELELRALDWQFRTLRGGERSPSRTDPVVVVGIDERSVRSIAEPVGLWHGYLARFLEALKPAAPRMAVLDVVMPDRSFEGIAPGLDRELLRALISTRSIFPTILAVTVGNDRLPRGIHPAFLAAAGTAPGFALWPVDGDGVIRRFDEALGERGEIVATLTGEAARRAGRQPGPGYIDYALGQPIDYVAFADVLEAAGRDDRDWLARRFAGKVVLLGMVLPFTDSVRVPVKLAAWDVADRETPGVLLHAQALRTILANRMVERASPARVAAFAFFAAVIALFATSPLRAMLLALSLPTVFALLSVAVLRDSTFLPLVWPALVGVLAVGVRQGIEVGSRLAERRRLRSSFSGSVSPAVMSQILEGRIVPKQGGVNLEVCVLFSDIRGYTTLSEGKSPEQIVALLNRYFDHMVSIIHDTGGTVVSFMGDGIMAVFGAPQPLPNSSQAGFDAAVRMLGGVREFNRELEAEGIAPIAIGVGLHIGEALVGHIGSKTRHDYTAIGDVTNVASRLESATKDAGYRIVVSREVAERLPDRSTLTPLGAVSIKGHTPVECFGYERVAPANKDARAEPAVITAARVVVAGLCIALAIAASPRAEAQRLPGAAALVSDLQGGVRVVRGKDAIAAKLLADIFPDSRLEVDAGATVVLLMLASGEEVTVRGAATAQLASGGVSADPPQAISRRTIGVGDVQLRRKDLAQAAIVMRKTDQTVRPPLLSLAGTYTLDDPPVFRWSPVEDSGPYRVTLFDDASKVLFEATTTATEHPLPGSVALAQQRRYTWEVATRKANGVEHSNFGDFALATPVLRREAESRRPRSDARFSERVAYAVWLDTQELSDAARDVWKRLAAERPGDERLRQMAEQ